jgi:hypothetical protein
MWILFWVALGTHGPSIGSQEFTSRVRCEEGIEMMRSQNNSSIKVWCMRK